MINSKRKGSAGEREFAAILRSYGYTDAHRTAQFKGGVDSPDVIGLPGIHCEIKRVENLNVHKAYAQAVKDAAGQKIPAVFHRRTREKWMVTLSLDDFMEIYGKWIQRELLSR